MADEKKDVAVPTPVGVSGPVVVQGVPLADTSYAAGKPVKVYKLKAGKKHTHDGEAVKPGDAVYLTENQAKAFADKFEAADGSGFKVVTHADLVKLRPAQVSTPAPVGVENKPKIVNT